MKSTLIKFSLLGLVFVSSCTKLNEKDELYDTVTSDSFYKTDSEILTAVRAAYTN